MPISTEAAPSAASDAPVHTPLLTYEEAQALDLLSEARQRTLSRELGITTAEARELLRSARRKLGARNTDEAIRLWQSPLSALPDSAPLAAFAEAEKEKSRTV